MNRTQRENLVLVVLFGFFLASVVALYVAEVQG